MVFSFFKKEPEKMVARPAAVPRPKGEKAGATDALTVSRPGAGVAPAAPASEKPADPVASTPAQAPPISADDRPSLDFVFSESSIDFQVEGEIDPIDAEAEEAAILFANGQDPAVRAVLENSVRVHPFGPGERLWLMLFDFYRLGGDREAFEALEIEYARAFERSPPGWRAPETTAKAPAKETGTPGSLPFRGELVGENVAGFQALCQSLEKNPKLRLDVAKITQVDALGCGYLIKLLQQARKVRREFELVGRDNLARLLEALVEVGRKENQECWLLLLELRQLHGDPEAFENLAIDYAVTFEVSPPSWEPSRVAPATAPAAPPPAPEAAAPAATDAAPGDAYVIRGEIKGSRFADLKAHAEQKDPVVIDCSGLKRMDFISAGALLNVLTTIRQSGKQIVFHHPNHLVAELLGVVGIRAVATIVVETR